MPDWITKYWIEWIFGILCAILAGCYRQLNIRFKKEKEENDALRNGMRALLMRQIVTDCQDAIREGYCDPDRKSMILNMYNSYHALGGNGAVTSIKDEMMALPSVNPEGGEG